MVLFNRQLYVAWFVAVAVYRYDDYYAATRRREGFKKLKWFNPINFQFFCLSLYSLSRDAVCEENFYVKM